MRYSLISVTDGNFLVRSEWSDKESAFKAFHGLCAALYNDSSFHTAMVKVMDENLDCVDGKMEYIVKEPETPEVPETEE